MKNQGFKEEISRSRFLLLTLLSLAIKSRVVSGCNKRGELYFDEQSGGDVHHHHHYGQDGQPQAHPFPQEALRVHATPVIEQANPYGQQLGYGNPVIVTGSEKDHSSPVAKNVIVLQPAPPPPPPHSHPHPLEEDLLAAFFPKKNLLHLYPRRFLNRKLHRLRNRFRALLGLHLHPHGPHPHGPGQPHIIHHQHPPNVAISGAKVPLVQVEAYKPAVLAHPGARVNALAYISPDGYRPAVVVKQQKPHIHLPHGHPPGPHPHGQQQVVYQSQPDSYQPESHYAPQPQQVAPYQPQGPVAYQPGPPPPPLQQQQQQQAYHQPHPHQHPHPHQSVSYSPHVHQSPETNAYGPQGYQASQPLFESNQGSHFGNPHSSPFGSSGLSSSNPFDGSFGGSSSFK